MGGRARCLAGLRGRCLWRGRFGDVLHHRQDRWRPEAASAPETFIIRQGRALFSVGDRTIEARAGQIVIAPANMPHKFVNLGPGRLETTDLHVSGSFSTEWLE